MSQLHISKDVIIELEKYSNDYETYKKLLTFVETIHVERLIFRLESIATIFRFKNESSHLNDFVTFEDIEKFIFENRDELLLASHQKLTFTHFSNFDKKKFAKYLNLQLPDLTGSRRDKVVKLITTYPKINVSFDNVVNIIRTWIASEKFYQLFGVDLESIKDYDELLHYLQQEQQYQTCFHFIKKLKPELSKNISTTDKQKVLTKIIFETNDLNKYDPLFEQSHHYTSLDLFIEDFNGYFKILEHKSFLETIKKIKTPVVYEDNVPNSKAPKTLIIEVKDFNQISKISCSSWCLTRSHEQWNTYVGNHLTTRKFFIIYGFQKKAPNNILGVTYDFNTNTVPFCQNADNKPAQVTIDYLKIMQDYCKDKNAKPAIASDYEKHINEIVKSGRLHLYKDYFVDEAKRYMIDSAERFFGRGDTGPGVYDDIDQNFWKR
jgi:hypothetical protein